MNVQTTMILFCLMGNTLEQGLPNNGQNWPTFCKNMVCEPRMVSTCLNVECKKKKKLLVIQWGQLLKENIASWPVMLKIFILWLLQLKFTDPCIRIYPSKTSVLKAFCYHKKLELTKCVVIFVTKKISPKRKIIIFCKHRLKLKKMQWGDNEIKTYRMLLSSFIPILEMHRWSNIVYLKTTKYILKMFP